jgi:hypothetical protein
VATKRDTKIRPAQILVRLPVELHKQLLAESSRQGVPLQQLCLALLSGGLASVQAGTGFKLPADWLGTPRATDKPK